MGVPAIYGNDIRQTILHRLSEGETLRAICRTDGFPDISTVLWWVREDRPDGFAQQYARARELGYQVMADELIDEARNPRRGMKKVTKPDGVEIEEKDAVDRSRLHVDTLKWLLSKALPKIYGQAPAETEQNNIVIEGGLPEE